jgi:quercetin dioxygenase-like cupin family protein
MTRRGMNTALGAAFATLLSGTIASLRAESAAPNQSSREHTPSNHSRGGVTTLMHESVGDIGDSEASVLIITLPPKFPGGHPHKHPGPVFVYVLEGRIENQVDPGKPTTYNTGDCWYEPAMHVHRVLRNLNDTETARVLVFQLTPKGEPSSYSAK